MRAPRARRRWVGALGVAVALQDLWLAHGGASWSARALPVLVYVVAHGLLVGASLDGLGLHLRPAGGWGRWCRLGVRLGLVVLGLVGVLVGGAWLAGRPLALAPLFDDSADLRWFLENAVLWAPLVEEGVWRLVLCSALLGVCGARTTLLLSWAGFALLHWVYGNPAPDNQVAGLVLGWAYLASGCAAVPIALHAAGNLFVFCVHALWFALG